MSAISFVNAMLNDHKLFEQICLYLVTVNGIEKLNTKLITSIDSERERMMKDYWKLANTQSEDKHYDTPIHMAKVNQDLFLAII